MASNRNLISAEITPPTNRMLDDYRRHVAQTFERAALRTVDTISRRGRSALRERFAGAGLGRLGNAIGSSADEVAVHMGGDGFSVSARFFTRTRSERTLGALKAYTEGADIAPRRGRWLWVPTRDAQRMVGKGAARRRLTPALWRENGLDQRLGPLILLRSVNGHPIMAVENVSADPSGRKRGVRPLTKKGDARKGQVKRDLVVMFVGIPRTARAARVSITEILNSVRAQMPDVFATELAKERR